MVGRQGPRQRMPYFSPISPGGGTTEPGSLRTSSESGRRSGVKYSPPRATGTQSHVIVVCSRHPRSIGIRCRNRLHSNPPATPNRTQPTSTLLPHTSLENHKPSKVRTPRTPLRTNTRRPRPGEAEPSTEAPSSTQPSQTKGSVTNSTPDENPHPRPRGHRTPDPRLESSKRKESIPSREPATAQKLLKTSAVPAVHTPLTPQSQTRVRRRTPT